MESPALKYLKTKREQLENELNSVEYALNKMYDIQEQYPDVDIWYEHDKPCYVSSLINDADLKVEFVDACTCCTIQEVAARRYVEVSGLRIYATSPLQFEMGEKAADGVSFYEDFTISPASKRIFSTFPSHVQQEILKYTEEHSLGPNARTDHCDTIPSDREEIPHHAPTARIKLSPNNIIQVKPNPHHER